MGIFSKRMGVFHILEAKHTLVTGFNLYSGIISGAFSLG